MLDGARRNGALALVFTILFCGPAAARNAASKTHEVDAGSFAIFAGGQQIATETFHIEEGLDVSTASAEFKTLAGERVLQKSELQITSTGELRRYEWHELSPGKAQLVVEPSDQFLIEHIVPNPPERPVEQPFILPVSTMVLDDNFFSQREILAWRYLASACGGKLQQCRPGRTQFGVLAPRQRAPLLVTLEYAGVEKIRVGATERELNRLNLKIVDDTDWVLYLDSNLKLVRISIPAEKIEVVRE